MSRFYFDNSKNAVIKTSDQDLIVKPSSLDLFKKLPIQNSFEYAIKDQIYPQQAITHGNPIIFEVSGSREWGVDLSSFAFNLHLKIVKSDGSNLTADDDNEVTFTSNFPQSIWRNINLKVSGVDITPSLTNYSYKSYFETISSAKPIVSKRILKESGFYLDSGEPEWNAADSKFIDNSKFKERCNLTNGSKTLEFQIKPHIDFLNQKKILIPLTDLEIICYPHTNPKFALLQKEEKYDFRISQATLWVDKVKLSPDEGIRLESALEITPASYVYPSSLLRTFIINAGAQSFSEQNVFSNKIPQRLIIALVDHESFMGSSQKNPYNFTHSAISDIRIQKNGSPAAYLNPLKGNFEDGLFTDMYLSMCDILKIDNRLASDGLYWSKEDFLNGSALFGFDLSSSSNFAEYHVVENEVGSLSIQINFSRGLTHPMQVLIYGLSHSKTFIFSDRHCHHVE